jgi:glycosyltransferase involved in cell wall biosynthesis
MFLKVCLSASGWPSVPPIGSGATEYDVYGLGMALAKLGNEVWLVDTSNEYQRNRKLSLSPLNLRKVWHPHANLALLDHPSSANLTHLVRQGTQLSYSLFSIGAFVRLIKERKIDILNIHHRYPGLSAYVARKLALASTPLVFSSHTTLWIAERMSTKMRYFLFPETFCLRKATRVTAVSKTLKQYIARNMIVPQCKISVIYNGVDSTVFSPGEKILHDETPTNLRVILCVSNIEKRKNQEAIIRTLPDVMKIFPNVQLLLIGKAVEPLYLKYLKDLCRALKIEKAVTFAGEIPMFELPRYIREADVVVVPTKLESTIPRTLIEALSCGKATLVSKIPTITEVVTKDVCAFADVEDTNEMSDALLRLLTDGKYRKCLERNSRIFALKNFDWVSIARDYLKVYSNALTVS